jgi:hypothetical protein
MNPTKCDTCNEDANFIKIDLNKNKDKYTTMEKSLTISQMKHLDLFDEIPYKFCKNIDDEDELDVEITEVDPDVEYRTKYQFVFELSHNDGDHIVKKQFTHTFQYAGGSIYCLAMDEILRRECRECSNELDDDDEEVCMECQEKEYYDYYDKYDSIDLFRKKQIEQQDWTEDVRELGDEVQIERDLPESINDLPFRWELSFKEQKMIMAEIEVSECMTIQFYQRVTRDDNRKQNTCVVYVKIHPIDRVLRCEYSGSSGNAIWLSELGLDFEYDDN